MPVRENPIAALSVAIPQIFQECQKAVTNHRKNAITLRKLQLKCSKYIPLNLDATSEEEEITNGELMFNEEFVRNLNKVLPIKKGLLNVERVIRFIAFFAAFNCEKDNELLNKRDDSESNNDENDIEDMLSSRFIEYLIKHLLKGTEAKDKNVRLRVCQLLAHLVASLGSIDDELYEHLKDELTKRLLDKEPRVRVKAVLAYSKLQCDSESGKECTNRMLKLLNNDPSAEVRRAVLFNIEYNEETLLRVLERARDVDANIRRSVYSILFEEIQDFRVFSIEERERLLNWGLKDRDPHVKKACEKILAISWIQHANNNILELLERLDVVGSKIAHEVLLSIFRERSDITQSIEFDESFWENLNAERALLSRVFFEFHKDNERRLDEIMPEVTRLAFYIQKYNNYISQVSEDEQVNYVFIVNQLLLIAKLMDYGDEIGRRKMHSLLREMLVLPHIEESYIGNIMEVMKKISINERDFTRSMIEIISDIREGIEDEDESRPTLQEDLEVIEDMSQLSIEPERNNRRPVNVEENTELIDNEQRAEAKLVSVMLNLKSLHIVRCVLEKNSEELRDNPSMYGLLSEIIVPNVQSPEPTLREFGTHCLGLCCILDQQLAVENFDLFIHYVRHGFDTLQIKSLMIIFDILMVYGYSSIVAKTRKENEIPEFFNECLNHRSEQIQGIAVVGISKLMLSKMLREKGVLKELVMLYFDPYTSTNLHLRQCLSYFLPVFCHSSYENQILMQEIFLSTLIDLAYKCKNYEKSNETVTPFQIAQQLVDWTDPTKVVKLEQAEEIIDDNNESSHVNIAIEILKHMFSEVDKEMRKLLCQTLNKLHIDKSADVIQFKKLTYLTGNLKAKRPLTDNVAKNALNRFESNLLRYFEDASDALDDNELNQLNDLTEFVNSFEEIEIAPTSRPTRSTRLSEYPKRAKGT
ncbi:4953_t:CDS:10 [Diversispora eburnea]|uniref:4953_t:CDS:1 n=1 Tax=Diversispora eburnea TaxID=1213867 RepID=A0A9N8WB35_9GLOM|nr:4953_t:CDS:10 [Diversispora eburnea]